MEGTRQESALCALEIASTPLLVRVRWEVWGGGDGLGEMMASVRSEGSVRLERRLGERGRREKSLRLRK